MLKNEGAQNVFFDTETTGIGDDAEIIEVGIIDANGTVLVNRRIKPQGDISPQASNVHGITKDMLESEACFDEVYQDIYDALAAKRVFIYNASFDTRMLEQSCAKHGLQMPSYSSFCVMKDYAKTFKAGKWTKLGDACKEQNIDTRHLKAHSAVDDCEMTRLLCDAYL